ncbi:hypothetical protein KP626_00060 [Christensenella sp. MSJ-20]|uniref:abortive infection system antitoxin AbiGi family protein n=1 Tax=Christensenella sp. MSJ-20 TaxID=2841518 RepID=UPI001C750404|nr:hypothetical protein KP626_00060 [Christensenella sp. MSJ-20]
MKQKDYHIYLDEQELSQVMTDNYVSNLLCHFVGRSRKTDDDRFELLVTIIKGGRLIANLTEPDNPESLFNCGYQCEHVGEVFGKCDCVCFCDIPDESLAIHTNKYSKFGMGFEKTLIAEQGAHPVMYVPKNYPVVERGDSSDKGRSYTPRNPEQYFPYLLQTAVHLLPLMEIGYIGINLSQQEALLKATELGKALNLFDGEIRRNFFDGKYHPMIFSILQGIAHQMAYVKLYDATLPDDHPDNYYMEREWRSLKNISFSIHDIKTVYLPSHTYKERFMHEFPEYTGSFHIFKTTVTLLKYDESCTDGRI